jgi:metal-responsive CopG/Arc/MetJ family transcriptional regulator
MAKIAISLPDEVLQAVERERLVKGESRSAFFRRAVEQLLRREREREADERYVRGYLEFPETEEELAWAQLGLAALAADPWDEGDDQSVTPASNP